jgi:hypothetical protein
LYRFLFQGCRGSNVDGDFEAALPVPAAGDTVNVPFRLQKEKNMSIRSFTTLFLLTLFLAVSLGGALPALAGEEPVIEPRVDQLLKAASDYLMDAKEYTFHADISVDDVLSTGTMIQYGASFDAAARRPNRLRTVYQGDLRNSSTWYDGKTFSLLNRDENLYATWDAPSKIDALVAELEEKLGHMIPLSSLYLSDPYKAWTEGVKAGTYAGKHLVGDVPCHHLVLLQEDIDAQVWIEVGRQLVIRKVVLTFKKQLGSPQFTAVFSDWDFAPRLPDLLFTFVPPPDADRIQFLPAGQ